MFSTPEIHYASSILIRQFTIIVQPTRGIARISQRVVLLESRLSSYSFTLYTSHITRAGWSSHVAGPFHSFLLVIMYLFVILHIFAWILLLFSIQIAATPVSLPYTNGTRSGNDTSPGIGIELEYRGLVFTSNNTKASTASHNDISNIKGKTGKVLDNSGATMSPTKEWALTAKPRDTENATSISQLVGDFIVDGLLVKLGSGRVSPIAKEILGFMVGRS